MFRLASLLVAAALVSTSLTGCGSTQTGVDALDTTLNSNAQRGFVITKSNQSYRETLNALDQAIRSKGLRLFTRVSHSSNAAGASLDLGPTELFLFGNPKVGTLLMQASRTVGLDLPQRMLVWEDEHGVHIAHNDPTWLGSRHEFDHPALPKISGLLQALATAAAGSLGID